MAGLAETGKLAAELYSDLICQDLASKNPKYNCQVYLADMFRRLRSSHGPVFNPVARQTRAPS